MYTVYVYVGRNVKMKQIQLMHAYAYIGNICLTFNECFVHAVHLGDIYAMFAECAGTFSVSWVCMYTHTHTHAHTHTHLYMFIYIYIYIYIYIHLYIFIHT